jgi:hypothetical protein
MKYGTYEDYYGDVYLRTVTETREVPKYPIYPDFWVFEKIQPNLANPELKATLSYEPIWVFRDKKGERVQPEQWAIECIVQADRAVKKMRLSPKDIEANEELRMAREKMRYKMMLQDESPITATMVHNGSGIFVPSTYEKKAE